jgi:hypothetical protein
MCGLDIEPKVYFGHDLSPVLDALLSLHSGGREKVARRHGTLESKLLASLPAAEDGLLGLFDVSPDAFTAACSSENGCATQTAQTATEQHRRLSELAVRP